MSGSVEQHEQARSLHNKRDLGFPSFNKRAFLTFSGSCSRANTI